MFTVQWFRAKSVLKARYTIWDEIPCKAGATKYATDEGLSPPLKKMECLSTSFGGAMKGYGWQQVIFLLIPAKWRESLMYSITELIQGFSNVWLSFFLLGMKVFVHGGAATPLPLLDAVAKRGKEVGLKNVELIHIHTEGSGEMVKPEYDGE